MGLFYGLDPATGLVKAPGLNINPPNSQCSSECLKATPDSTECFDCIADVLKETPSLCPNVVSADDLQAAVSCQLCVGLQARLTNDKDPLGNIWDCITGTVPSSMSANTLVALVVAGVFFLTIIIVLMVFFLYILPKNRKSAARQQLLIAHGVDPTSIDG
jgi:hypothetical protein